MCINIFWVFSSIRNEEKNNMCEKREKKNDAETELGYCLNRVTIQWKLYRDIAILVCSGLGNCIATLGCWGSGVSQ